MVDVVWLSSGWDSMMGATRKCVLCGSAFFVVVCPRVAIGWVVGVEWTEMGWLEWDRVERRLMN